jgi:hypothetical protein
MSTTETGPYPETGNDRAAALARAACEAFWAAIEPGPPIQEPGAAWNWAKNQKATGAWAAAAKAAVDANLTAADDGTLTAAGRLADVLGRLNAAHAEMARLRNGAHQLGKIVAWQAQSMEAARIEMIQNGPEKAMQWILNSIPDVDDNDPEDQWNGTETASEWLDRQQAADRAWAAAKAGTVARPCDCGPDDRCSDCTPADELAAAIGTAVHQIMKDGGS